MLVKLNCLLLLYFGLCGYSLRLNFNENPVNEASTSISEPSKPLVLFNLMFGTMDKASTQLFIKSVANTDVDYVFIGDASPVGMLPENIQHVHMTWSGMVDHLQLYFPKFDLTAIREASYYKACDVKPFAAMIAQDVVDNFHRYRYWGYVDTDAWLGDTSVLAAKLMERNEDVFIAFDNKAWGPFQIYRNNEFMTKGIWTQPQNREIAQYVLQTKWNTNFPEWGGYHEGARGVKYSMTGILNSSISSAQITVAELGHVFQDGDHPMGFVMWDCACQGHQHDENCGFCEMRVSEAAPGQPSSTRLFADGGHETFLCHFQCMKERRGWYALTRFDDMQEVLKAPIIDATYVHDVFIPSATEQKKTNGYALTRFDDMQEVLKAPIIDATYVHDVFIPSATEQKKTNGKDPSVFAWNDMTILDQYDRAFGLLEE